MNEEKIEQAIIEALEKAGKEGQPVAELMEAVKNGAELDAWLEPGENGNWTLILSAETKEQRQE